MADEANSIRTIHPVIGNGHAKYLNIQSTYKKKISTPWANIQSKVWHLVITKNVTNYTFMKSTRPSKIFEQSKKTTTFLLVLFLLFVNFRGIYEIIFP